jgi:hypothetical protein
MAREDRFDKLLEIAPAFPPFAPSMAVTTRTEQEDGDSIFLIPFTLSLSKGSFAFTSVQSFKPI